MKLTSRLLAIMFVLGSLSMAHAQTTKYWDINGSSPGAGRDGFGFSDGTWDTTTANWNTDPNGSSATTTWTDGDIAVFSAGSASTTPGNDAVDTALLIPAGRTVSGLIIEDGKVALPSGAGGVVINANPARINQGATLSIPNLNVITATSGHVLTLDGGKLQNTIVGVGSGIYTNPSSAGRIEITAKGGTLDTPSGAVGGGAINDPNGAYSILLYNGFVGLAAGETSGTLHKTGHGEFRGLNNWTFTALDVQEGLYRLNGTGGGDTGFGAATGTVTVAGGATPNTSLGASVGTSIGVTSPATRSFVLSGVGSTPYSGFVINAGWTINGPISGPGGLMLNGLARTDGGPAAPTASVLGSQSQILTLGGTNTYGGGTLINFGTLVATGGSAIPNTSTVEISTNSSWGGGNTVVSTLNTAVLQIGTSTVAATETIGSLKGGNATRGSVSILNSGSSLITGADNSTTTYSGAISGAGSLQKTGTGTFTIDGAKSYTGDTKVLGGTLSTNSASLADTADVYLTTGSFFNLNFAGTDTIDSLFIDGTSVATGTWGGTGSGATHISTLLTGTGLLQVTTVAAPPGVPGDYNNNGVVDAADYVLWRDGGPLQNEVDTPGTVNNADYDAWRARFGNTSGSGSSLGGNAAVPEPASLAMILLCLSGCSGWRRGR
ncbi:MAG: hypothetical protein U0805_03870 [Pirellulales bacterium]